MDDKRTETILEAFDLRRRFGRTQALGGVTLQLRAAQVVCLIGLNGAGKTTLLNLLGGLIFPTSGHVRVFGKHRWKENYEIRCRTTFLPAEPIFGSCPTPWEYLKLVADAYRIPYEQLVDRARPLCDQMSMIPHMGKNWTKLSLGMQKKAGLIGAFLPEAELRILDEPFAGGIDPTAMEALRGWIGVARERGEAVLFSTQVLEQSQDLADRLLVLRDGLLEHDGPPRDLIERAGLDPAHPRALNQAFARLTGAPEGGSPP